MSKECACVHWLVLFIWPNLYVVKMDLKDISCYVYKKMDIIGINFLCTSFVPINLLFEFLLFLFLFRE